MYDLPFAIWYGSSFFIKGLSAIVDNTFELEISTFNCDAFVSSGFVSVNNSMVPISILTSQFESIAAQVSKKGGKKLYN